jgi:hypothetical protein
LFLLYEATLLFIMMYKKERKKDLFVVVGAPVELLVLVQTIER